MSLLFSVRKEHNLVEKYIVPWETKSSSKQSKSQNHEKGELS